MSKMEAQAKKAKGLWGDFKKFAFKGNVLDMAVGVIIGGAFGKIVTSVVNDLIMPIFGFITSGADFKTLKWVLSPAVVESPPSCMGISSRMWWIFSSSLCPSFCFCG